MGCRILSQEFPNATCLCCSTTGVAFGPIFDSAEEAESFAEWLNVDARIIDPELLMEAHAEWFRTHHDENGEPSDKPFTDEESLCVLSRVQQAEQEHERRRRSKGNTLRPVGPNSRRKSATT